MVSCTHQWRDRHGPRQSRSMARDLEATGKGGSLPTPRQRRRSIDGHRLGFLLLSKAMTAMTLARGGGGEVLAATAACDLGSKPLGLSRPGLFWAVTLSTPLDCTDHTNHMSQRLQVVHGPKGWRAPSWAGLYGHGNFTVKPFGV
jgi:hypothetical protein